MSKTALIIVDMVKDFTDPEGLVYYPQNREVLPKIARVLEESRRHGLLTIFLQHCYRKGKPDKNLVNMRPNCIEGSGGEDIDSMLEVREEDYVIRKRRYLELVFDKNGLVGGLIYAMGIWACYHFVGSGYQSFPSNPVLYAGLGVGLLLLLVKGPVYAVHKARLSGHREKVGTVVMDTIMDFLVQVLEIFSGFLSNTLSFMRVAGLGIAHVSLMTAFEQIAEMTGSIVPYVLIMVIGNVLVIALEGLSAGIQSLRLNYYEFFTRYFTGRGIAYEPVGLKSRIVID